MQKLVRHRSMVLGGFRTSTGIRLDRMVDEKSPTTIGSSSEPLGSRDFGKEGNSTPSTV
jgi:hypothetical protein